MKKAKDLEKEAIAIYEEDLAANRAMGDLGAALIPEKARVMTHCNAGALATAGYGTALGVIRSSKNKQVSVIANETRPYLQGARLTAYEMVQEGIPVKMAVFNNGYLGMVRQWQQFFHGRRYSATPIWSPDYVKLAGAYGIYGRRVERGDEVEAAVREAIAQPGPALVEFLIEQEANVFPMIPPGASLSEPIEGEPASPRLVPA